MEQKDSFVVRLSEVLVKNGVLEEKDAAGLVEEFQGKEKGRIDYFLLDEGLVELDDLLVALSTIYQTTSFDVRGHFFNHEWLLYFPKEFLLKHAMIPLEMDDDIMTIVMSDPEDEEALEEIGSYISNNVNVVVGFRRDIIDAVMEYYDEDVATLDIEDQEADENKDDDMGDDFEIIDIEEGLEE